MPHANSELKYKYVCIIGVNVLQQSTDVRQQVSLAFGGSVAGPLFGLFVLGGISRRSNWKVVNLLKEQILYCNTSFSSLYFTAYFNFQYPR
jgi:hypothetical protein